MPWSCVIVFPSFLLRESARRTRAGTSGPSSDTGRFPGELPADLKWKVNLYGFWYAYASIWPLPSMGASYYSYNMKLWIVNPLSKEIERKIMCKQTLPAAEDPFIHLRCRAWPKSPARVQNSIRAAFVHRQTHSSLITHPKRIRLMWRVIITHQI